MSSGSNFFASSGQATRLLSLHHDDPLAPPRVPDHQVDWTRGRSPSIPGQQGPQWAPRPPQRQCRSQHQVSPPSVSVSSLSSNSKPFFSSKPYWALSYSLLYVHVSSSWVSCSLGGFQKAIFASYCVEAKMSAALANGKIKVSVRSNSCADRCLYFELGNV